MKKNGSTTALLAPDVRGWRLKVSGGEERTLASLDEAVAALPSHAQVELALPCDSVLLERHTLPSTDRAELADMLQLQLEKSLPFPVEEVSHGFEVLGQNEAESTVLSITAHRDQLDRICEPLRASGRLPKRITLNALRYAAACAEAGTVLALWPEGEQLVVAIVAGGKLAWAECIGTLEPGAVAEELPGMLLTAEVEGAPGDFQAIRVSGACPEIAARLAEHFGREIGTLEEPQAAGEDIDLLPAEWEQEAKSRERNASLKQSLLVAAVIYLVLVAGAFIYLAWTKKKVQDTLARHAAMKPRFVVIGQQMDRWNALAPAVEPGRHAAEVLHQLTRNWPRSEALQFTNYTYSPREWTLKGEGTSDAVFEFTQKLKRQSPELTDVFKLPEQPATQPLKDDRQSFTLTGRPL